MKINELKELINFLEKLEKEPDFDEWFETDVENLEREILIYIDFLGGEK